MCYLLDFFRCWSRYQFQQTETYWLSTGKFHLNTAWMCINSDIMWQELTQTLRRSSISGNISVDCVTQHVTYWYAICMQGLWIRYVKVDSSSQSDSDWVLLAQKYKTKARFRHFFRALPLKSHDSSLVEYRYSPVYDIWWCVICGLTLLLLQKQKFFLRALW